MNDCCHTKLRIVQDKITDLMDCSMSDDFLKGLQAAIDEIDEVIFKSIADMTKVNK